MLSLLFTGAVVLLGADLGWRMRKLQTMTVKDNKPARAAHLYSSGILSSVWERTPGDIKLNSFGTRAVDSRLGRLQIRVFSRL
jgi:hypothetical protein